MSTTGLTVVDIPAAERFPSSRASGKSVDVSAERSAGFFRSKTARAMLLAGLLLLSIEAVVRVRAYMRYGVAGTQADIYEVDPELGRVPTAGATMVSAGATTTINRWHMRGPDITLNKPAGVTRILCLGESTTFGQPCDDNTSIWPARLEEMLNAEGHGTFEVLNGAMPGYTVSSSRLHFARRLARFASDIVVIYHASTNISAHVKREFDPEQITASPWSLSALRDRFSLAYMLLRSNTAALLADQFPAQRSDTLDQRGVDFFSNELQRLIEDCRAAGARVIVCTFPRAFDAGQSTAERLRLAGSALFFNPQLSVDGLEDAYQRYNDAIRTTALDERTVMVDLDRIVPRGDDDFIDSVHLSPSGHQLVAATVCRAIKDMTPTLSTPGG